jgi:hypothetical protein
MARRNVKQSFTVAHPYIAALAVFIVIVAVGSGVIMTGAYVTSSPTQHPVDIAMVDASFPEKLTDKTHYIGSITLANYGTVSASSVKYNVLVTNADSGGLTWQNEGRVALMVGETKTIELPTFDIVPGRYHVKATADSAYDFNEADELNNVFEDTFTVTE